VTFDFWLSIVGSITVMFLAVAYLDRRPSWRKDGRWIWIQLQRIGRSLFPPEEEIRPVDLSEADRQALQAKWLEAYRGGQSGECILVDESSCVRRFPPPKPNTLAKGFTREHAGTVVSMQQRGGQ